MNFWIQSADADYDTMMILFKNKKFSWTLFIGQLVVEKLFKAMYAKNNKNNPHAPRSHDLVFLSKKVGLELNEQQEDILEEITRFNMSGRYDDYKKNFQKLCTQEYTKEKLENIEEVIKWLKKLLKE